MLVGGGLRRGEHEPDGKPGRGGQAAAQQAAEAEGCADALMLVAAVLAALVSRTVLPQPIYHALAEVNRSPA